MIDYVEEKCRSLPDAQRQQLAVTMDDVVFALPEDASVAVDQYGEFCCDCAGTTSFYYHLVSLSLQVESSASSSRASGCCRRPR